MLMLNRDCGMSTVAELLAPMVFVAVPGTAPASKCRL